MQVKGVVVAGQGKAGGYYGVPTANLHLEKAIKNEPGVYAGEVNLMSGERLPGIICYGAGQDEQGLKFEFHIFNWHGHLCGQTVEVHFKQRVSSLVPFENEEQMRDKIMSDVAEAKRILGVK